MSFPLIWYVRPAKALTSLRIRAVWSEPLLVVWKFYDCQATDRTAFGVSKLKKMLYRYVGVYTCQNATLLEISCRCSTCLIKKGWYSSFGSNGSMYYRDIYLQVLSMYIYMKYIEPEGIIQISIIFSISLSNFHLQFKFMFVQMWLILYGQ